MAYGKKCSEEEEKLAVSDKSVYKKGSVLIDYIVLLCDDISQPDPFKLKTGGLVDLKEISTADIQGLRLVSLERNDNVLSIFFSNSTEVKMKW